MLYPVFRRMWLYFGRRMCVLLFKVESLFGSCRSTSLLHSFVVILVGLLIEIWNRLQWKPVHVYRTVLLSCGHRNVSLRIYVISFTFELHRETEFDSYIQERNSTVSPVNCFESDCISPLPDRAQRSRSTVLYVWIGTRRSEDGSVLPGGRRSPSSQIRLLSAMTRTFTKGDTRMLIVRNKTAAWVS